MSPDERQAFRRRLQERLRGELPQEQADRLYYHLGDLHDAFADSMRLIMQVLDSEAGSLTFRKSLASLSGELIEHIPSHLSQVGPDLEAWRDRVYEEAEKRGEL